MSYFFFILSLFFSAIFFIDIRERLFSYNRARIQCKPGEKVHDLCLEADADILTRRGIKRLVAEKPSSARKRFCRSTSNKSKLYDSK
jgi:hypothetical protein